MDSTPKSAKRQAILDAIRFVAEPLGRAPTVREFRRSVPISIYAVQTHFPNWNDAVIAAGLAPAKCGKSIPRQAALASWGNVTRDLGRIPKTREYRRHAAAICTTKTLTRILGSWSSLSESFRAFAGDNPEWSDVLPLLPAAPPETPPAIRPLVGSPLDLHPFPNEPTEEIGVVCHFTLLARQLGFVIEIMQARFPDCTARRRIRSQWELVRIEFEFESRNFLHHGHKADECDMIVCWKHNWPDCPKNLEVVELCTFVKQPSPPARSLAPSHPAEPAKSPPPTYHA